MAVAKPSVYQPRSLSRPGATSPLGQGFGAIADALDRRGARLAREKELEEARRTKEHKRKSDLLYLRGRNTFADWVETQRNSGAWEGMDAARQQQAMERKSAELGQSLMQHDPVQYEQLQLDNQATIEDATATTRTREREDAEDAVAATYAEAEMGAKRRLPTLWDVALNAKSPEEQNAAFVRIQAEIQAVKRARSGLSDEQRAKDDFDIQAFNNKLRFDAADNHAIENGDVHEFYSRIRNNTDFVGGSKVDRWSIGIDGAYIAKKRKAALAAAAERKREAEAAATASRQAEKDAGEAMYTAARIAIFNKKSTTEEEYSRLMLAGYPKWADKIEATAVERNERLGKRTEAFLLADPDTQALVQSNRADLMTTFDRKAIRERMNGYENMALRGEIGKGQEDLLLATARNQLDIVTRMEQEMSDEEATAARSLGHAWRAEYQKAGLIGDSFKTADRGLGAQQLHLMNRLRPQVDTFLLREGATPERIDLVVNQIVPVLIAQALGEQGGEVFGGGRGDAQAMVSPGTEPVDPLGITRALNALSRTGLTIDSHKEWLPVILKPWVGTHVRYDADGNVLKGHTIQSLERDYGMDDAMHVYETVVDPAMRTAESLNGARSGLDEAENDAKWLKHWEEGA